MRRPEPGRRLAVLVMGVVYLAVAGGAFVLATPPGSRVPQSPALVLLIAVPAFFGTARVASVLLTDTAAELARAERLARGLTVAATFVVVAAVLVLVGGDGVSLAHPGPVVVAAAAVIVLAIPGVLFGLSLVLDGPRARFAGLLGVTCFWTPLAGAIAAGLAATPYFWLVATPPSVPKLVGSLVLAASGLGVLVVAVYPIRLVVEQWRRLDSDD